MSTSERRNKTKLIQVRATPDEEAKLKSRAAAFGISMGELCRRVIFGVKLKSKTDQDAILELSATRADLGRLGGLLKGWLAGSFPESPPPPKEKIKDLLDQIAEAKKDVVAAVKKLTSK